jgi:DNA modification methylase
MNNKKTADEKPKVKKEDSYIDLGERGRLSKKNRLNDLTGKEWLKFTKTWFIHRPKRRKDSEILHPAKYPESLVSEFISFFTKKSQWVFDPFAGTGSTNVASKYLDRNSIGIEVTDKYAKIANDRLDSDLIIEFEGKTINTVLCGNSMSSDKIIKSNYPSLFKEKFDFCVTSPPYWNQLKRNSLRQLSRKEKGLDTVYSDIKEDIGNIDDYNDFIKNQKKIFNSVYKLMKNKSYLVVITNNVFFDGRVFPLAFDTFNSLTTGKNAWVGKDEQIWCQDDKSLAVLGVNNAYVGNRHHQYCLIFRKEEDEGKKASKHNKNR